MCLYFGWAVKDIKRVEVWYEIDVNSFKGVLDAALTVGTQEKFREKAHDKIAHEIFHDPNYSPFISPQHKHLLYRTTF